MDNSGRLIALINSNWGHQGRDTFDTLSFSYVKLEVWDLVLYSPLILLPTEILKFPPIQMTCHTSSVLHCTVNKKPFLLLINVSYSPLNVTALLSLSKSL